jgi:hypothetical protein
MGAKMNVKKATNAAVTNGGRKCVLTETFLNLSVTYRNISVRGLTDIVIRTSNGKVPHSTITIMSALEDMVRK